MNRQSNRMLICVLVLVASATAQTTVTTTGGTANTVPLFTGTSTVGNSVITQINGNVGIGTTSPAARLTLDGSDSNIAGPHIEAFTAVDATYPVFQQLNWSHNNVSLNFDSYFNGGNWVSSSNTNNYQIYKISGLLDFNYAAGVTAGNALSWNTAMVITSLGNIGIGTTAPGARLEVNGNMKLTAGSGSSITFADGTTQSTAYTGTTCGGDYAESVDVTGDRQSYQPGDLLVIDPNVAGRFLKSAEAYATTVTGIYSTKPGTVGRRQTTGKSPNEVPMAMVGIVPTKVSAENGPIRPGDLLVSSSLPGHAMKGTDRSRMLGAVVGKALGSLDFGTGVIEIVVTLQ